MLCAVVFIALFVVSAFAHNHQHTHPETEGVFHIAGHSYSSKTEFINSGRRCGTADLPEEKKLEIEARLSSLPQPSGLEAMTVVKINVYWHTITSSGGTGALTNSVINSQINVLNEAYSSAGYTFFLKTIDTTKNNNWFTCDYGSTAETQMKTKLRKGLAKDLNIYTIANSEGILGWATFPIDAADYLNMDGVIIDYRTVPGGQAAPYNEGETLTHEVGHWLGLYHTFQGGCVTDVTKGDYVSDTPAVKSPNFGCPPDDTDSCPGNTGGLKGNDLVHNYMEYVDDYCMYQFTSGQKTRMSSQWQLYRA